MRYRVLLAIVLIVVSGCAESPTGRTRFAFVPDPVMANMGQQAFARMKQRRALDAGAPASELVKCVARRIIATAGDVYPDVEMPGSWEVVVFDDPTPNAFALPGGRIGVNRGLLRVAENPSQLAAVIGHEVAHVLAGHGNERLTQQLGLKAILLLVGLFSEGDVEQELLLQALGIGAQLGVALPFSRAHEQEADLMGLRIMAVAGFEPGESVALWRNMARQGGEQPPELLSTHPAHDSRIESLRAHMDEARERASGVSPASCPR